VNLSGKYADVIAGHFHGHTNSDVFSFVVSSSSKSGKADFDLITVSDKSPPSFTADSAPKVVGMLNNNPSIIPANNPAMRVYDYSPDNGQLLDYTQYYTDLVKDNANGNVQWQVEYKLKDAYGVNGLGPSDWPQVMQNLASGGQQFAAYSKRVGVQTDSTVKKKKKKGSSSDSDSDDDDED